MAQEQAKTSTIFDCDTSEKARTQTLYINDAFIEDESGEYQITGASVKIVVPFSDFVTYTPDEAKKSIVKEILEDYSYHNRTLGKHEISFEEAEAFFKDHNTFIDENDDFLTTQTIKKTPEKMAETLHRIYIKEHSQEDDFNRLIERLIRLRDQ